jgi:hypothetical protein
VTIQGTNDAPMLQAQSQAVSEDGAALRFRCGGQCRKRREGRVVVGKARAHRHDLAHVAHGFQERGGDGIAHASAHDPALPGELAHDMPADEARTPEYGDATTRLHFRPHCPEKPDPRD